MKEFEQVATTLSYGVYEVPEKEGWLVLGSVNGNIILTLYCLIVVRVEVPLLTDFTYILIEYIVKSTKP